VVERAIRPIALNRKNALFAGSDEGGANWAIIASLIETAKLNGVNPHAWLADTLTKLINRWPASRIRRVDAMGLRQGYPPLTRQRAIGAALTLDLMSIVLLIAAYVALIVSVPR
jgi:hypothetical protein